MQIFSLHLKNIKAHSQLSLDFSLGINVLSGPNGIGKSTVFEAIGYALFGVDAQSFVGNAERFITIGEKRGEVAVEFSVCDERFRISRSVGAPAKWLLARMIGGEFEIEEHKDAKETEARLKELLGLKGGRSLAEQFELVIGPFQHDFLGPFVIRQQSKRRDRFDEILGIDSWRKTFSETNGMLKALQARVAILESAIAPLNEQAKQLPDKLDQRQNVLKDSSLVDKSFQQKQQELVQTNETLLQLGQQEQQIKSLKNVMDTLTERIANGRDKISSHKVLIAEAEKSQVVVNESLAAKQSYEKAEQQLIELREKQQRQHCLEQEAAVLDKQLSSLLERYSTELNAIELANKEIDAEELQLKLKCESLIVSEQLRKTAASLPEKREQLKRVRLRLGQLDGRRSGLTEGQKKLAEGVCPFFQDPCQNLANNSSQALFENRFSKLREEERQLHTELADAEEQEKEAYAAHERIVQIETRIKGLAAELDKVGSRRQKNQDRVTVLAQSREEQKKIKIELENKQQSLKVYAQLATDIVAAETELKVNRSARDLYVAHQEQAAKLDSYLVELEKFDKLLTQLLAELAEHETALAGLIRAYDVDRHAALRNLKEELGREIGALGQKLESLRNDNIRLNKEIAGLRQIKEEIADKRRQIKDCGEKEKLVKFLRNRVFRNVSGSLSQRFREEIGQRANRIYRIIADVDEELTWGDNYQIVLRDMVGGRLRERIDDQLSGGQIMSSVVALRLAMLQTIGARIAFFDEPTSNLDAGRRENLAHAFRAIDVGQEEAAEHWYDQLFLISHDVAFTEVTDQMVSLEEQTNVS